jgi:hypothetical protein
MYVASNPDYWGVRCLYDAGDTGNDYGAIEVFRSVRNVIPQGTLPIAEDWSGNLYLLVCEGPNLGEVVWWNHEREENDMAVDRVAGSFGEFRGLLRHDEP